MNARKQRQKTKKKLCKQAELIERENAELVESVRETERTSWAKQVEKLGSVEKLAGIQAKQRLTKIPKNRPQRQKIKMAADDMPFEQINLKTGILTLGKLGKLKGYRAGADNWGLIYCHGKWRMKIQPPIDKQE